MIIRMLSLMLFACSLASCEKKRIPSVYEIPANYRGWVIIITENKDAPELKIVEESRIYPILKSGVLRTSSKKPDGWGTDEYYWIHDDGRRELFGKTGTPMIQQQGGGFTQQGDGPKTFYSHFYVGDGEIEKGSLSKVLAKVLNDTKK